MTRPLRSLAGATLLFLVCCLGLAVWNAVPTVYASTPNASPRIVILSSYHHSEEWADKELAGLQLILGSAFPDLMPSIEYLDTKRYTNLPHLDRAKKLLEDKYQGKSVDLVITLDNSALELILKAGEEIFPDVPVIFAGVNGFTPEMIRNRPNITGIAEEKDIAGTLEMALRMFPGTKRVLAIHDYTSTGLALRQEAEAALSPFRDRLRIDYTPKASMDDLLLLMAKQPPDTIALLLTFVTDSEGRVFSRSEGTRLFSSATSLPVFAMQGTRLDHGIVGGMLLFGNDHGKEVGWIALRILNGEKPQDIPVGHSRSVPMANYTQLQRFHILESMLPPGTTVVNKPSSIYPQYTQEIRFAVALVAMLLLSIAILLFFHRRARKAEKNARKAEQEYRGIFENAPMGVFKSSPKGRYQSVNPQGAAMFGYDSPRDMIECVTDIRSQVYANPMDPQTIFGMLCSRGRVTDYECGMKRKDGTIIQISFNGSIAFDDSGAIKCIDGFITDMTGRKQTEQALNLIMEGTAPVVGEYFFRALVSHLAHGLKMRYALVGEVTEDLKHIQTLAVWADGKPGENMEYSLRGSPCETATTTRDTCHVPENVAKLFPEDHMLVEMGAESYLGVALRDCQRKIIGILALVHDKPTHHLASQAVAIIKTFGARAGAELERKRTEQALRTSERRFRSYYDLGVVGMAVNGPDKQWLEVNDRLCDMLGYSREELSHLTWVDVTHPEDLPENLRLFEQIERGERDGYVVDKRFIHKEGRVVNVLVSTGVVRNPNGAINHSVMLAQEITDLKQAEGALLASEERYRTVFDSVADIIQLYDLDGNILDTNQAACERLGYTREELTKMNLREINETISAAEVERRLAQIQEKGHLSFEVEHIRKDGSSASTEMNARLMRFGGKDVVFSVGRDITVRKQIEQTMVKAKEAAETANQAKSEFLANMSHEIRTPLNGVLGMLQVLETTPLTEEQEEYISLALTSGRGLLTVINDILSFSKIEAGKLEIKKMPFNPVTTIQSVVEILRPLAKEKKLQLHLDLAPSFPPVLVGDQERLREILFNLVGNALKFTEHGEVSVTVEFTPRKGSQDSRVRLTISDTGIGIPEERLADLFHPFTQADGSTTRKYSGTGLGLSIVKRLVELMQGTLEIESREGVGTTISILLKMEQGETLQGPDQMVVPPLPIAKAALRILVAEDDPTNRLLTVKLLEKLGHTAVAVENGEKALAILRTKPIDAVLMDVQMPVMDGVETTRRIKSDTSGDFSPTLPVIALTAHAMEGDRETFLNAGMDGYLSKPLERGALESVLATLRPAPNPDNAPRI